MPDHWLNGAVARGGLLLRRLLLLPLRLLLWPNYCSWYSLYTSASTPTTTLFLSLPPSLCSLIHRTGWADGRPSCWRIPASRSCKLLLLPGQPSPKSRETDPWVVNPDPTLTHLTHAPSLTVGHFYDDQCRALLNTGHCWTQQSGRYIYLRLLTSRVTYMLSLHTFRAYKFSVRFRAGTWTQNIIVGNALSPILLDRKLHIDHTHRDGSKGRTML